MTTAGNRLSKHFTVGEFVCHDGTPVPPAAVGALQRWARDWGEPLRAAFGPVRVTSGYRHRLYNRGIGSTDGSYHVYELRVRDAEDAGHLVQVAADVTCRDGKPREVAQWAREHRLRDSQLRSATLGGVGEYRASGFTHLDTGPRRDWWG